MATRAGRAPLILAGALSCPYDPGMAEPAPRARDRVLPRALSDEAAVEARKKREMEEEVARVKKEYEEKQKKKKEKEEEKKKKDKDGDKKKDGDDAKTEGEKKTEEEVSHYHCREPSELPRSPSEASSHDI